MNNVVLVEAKAVLSMILNSDNVTLRRKGLEFVMELFNEIEMDYVKAEQAIKAEISGDKAKSDRLIETMLLDIDKVEYS